MTAMYYRYVGIVCSCGSHVSVESICVCHSPCVSVEIKLCVCVHRYYNYCLQTGIGLWAFSVFTPCCAGSEFVLGHGMVTVLANTKTA